MCRAVASRTCLTTWAGCGRHVDRVPAGVPSAQRCPGHAFADTSTGGGRLRRLLRRF
ncbi:hypothetical protein [Modestobacter sp. DSM 44400]|uniref:hypothetical protein n=1 Tax=Modestobacter sp. DSM 44400 TaxID=1550230 RepID=UPI000B803B28|nr:hypothetical protein [Modestobacter sp. DSM 44400]